MTDYDKLVAALRDTDFGDTCVYCEHPDMCKAKDCIIFQAADAIEALQAQLEDRTNAVELWKDMYVTKNLPQDEKDRILEYIRNAPIGPIETMQIELLPKRGEWIETEEEEWGIYPFKKQTCSVCDCKIDHTFMLACMDYFDDRDTVFHYCPNCGAKMEVQE